MYALNTLLYIIFPYYWKEYSLDLLMSRRRAGSAAPRRDRPPESVTGGQRASRAPRVSRQGPTLALARSVRQPRQAPPGSVRVRPACGEGATVGQDSWSVNSQSLFQAFKYFIVTLSL